MSKKSFLDSIQSPSPCSNDWDKMIGDERVRFCNSCEKKVYNISAMPRGEARRLVAQNGSKICIRYVRLSNGKVMTVDTKLYKITRRAGLAAGVFSATLTLSAMASAQTEPTTPKNEAAKIETRKDRDYSKTSRISFTIQDATGAIVPNAQVVLKHEESDETFTVVSNDEGVAQFEFLPHGRYEVEVSYSGFRNANRTIEIKQPIEPNIKVTLDAGIMMGVIVDVSYEIPLFEAIVAEDNETVKNMIASGFDVNTKEEESKTTALHVAVEHGNVEIVRLLLDKNAKVNAKDNEKRTPILMLEDLLDDDEEEKTLEILRLLINKGADLNAQGEEDKETILMMACDSENLEAVKILLAAGADPNVKDDDDKTAIGYTDSEDIQRLLIQYGARKTEN